ncbi:10767_t:CDS:2, partial [Gigaspora rosea]
MSHITSKSSYNQDESNEGSQLPETSDESVNPVNDEYIKLGTRDKHGHVAMKCKYCEDTTQRGRPNKNQEKLINYALTRFFACCGIPFWVIESPFFIDLLKNLNAGYKPPDRRTLSNLWIDQEVARIT